MMQAAGSGYRIAVEPEFPGDTRVMAPNVTATPVALGQWHRIEWYVKYATRVESRWRDQVVDGRRAAGVVHGSADAGRCWLQRYQLAPTWGGLYSVKSETDYYGSTTPISAGGRRQQRYPVVVATASGWRGATPPAACRFTLAGSAFTSASGQRTHTGATVGYNVSGPLRHRASRAHQHVGARHADTAMPRVLARSRGCCGRSCCCSAPSRAASPRWTLLQPAASRQLDRHERDRYDPVTTAGTVIDLRVADVSSTAATLTFTEVGDGGAISSYDVPQDSADGPGDRRRASRRARAPRRSSAARRRDAQLHDSRLIPATSYDFQAVAYRGDAETPGRRSGPLTVGPPSRRRPPPPCGRVVTPASATGRGGTTQQLTATLQEWSGHVVTGRPVTWTSTHAPESPGRPAVGGAMRLVAHG